MSQLQIPEQYLPGFDVIAALEKEDLNKIVAAFKNLPVGTGPQKMIATVSKEIPIPSIELVVQTIFSLGNLLASSNTPQKEMAIGLANAYYSEKQGKDPGINEKIEKIADKIVLIISASEHLKLTFKALGLLSVNERIYRESRIVTDIRLVFNDEIKDNQRHAVILHKLKLDSQVDDDVKEMYFTLDSNDLHKLKQQIERAIDKDIEIKKSYNSTFKIIDITD